MSWEIRALVGALMLTVILSGCVVQQREDGTSSTVRVGSRGKAGGAPVMRVNGDGVSARDLVASPHLRKSLRVFIHTLALEQEAVKQGVAVDEDRFQDLVDSYKQSVAESNKSWQEFLDEQSATEEEWLAQKRLDMLVFALVEKYLDITDEKMRQVWDADSDFVRNRYMFRYHVPESELESVEFEDCKDVIRDMIWEREGGPYRDQFLQDLLDNTTLDLLCFDSENEASMYEDLILHYIQTGGPAAIAPTAPSAPGEAGQASGFHAPPSGGEGAHEHEHGEPAEQDSDGE